MWNELSERWCKTMHSKAMWPMHGRYICPDCGREIPVPWEVTPPAVEYMRPPEPARESIFEEWGRKLTWSARLLLQRAVAPRRSDTL